MFKNVSSWYRNGTLDCCTGFDITSADLVAPEKKSLKHSFDMSVSLQKILANLLEEMLLKRFNGNSIGLPQLEHLCI